MDGSRGAATVEEVCGRFVAASPAIDLVRHFDVAVTTTTTATPAPSHNVAPTDDIAIITAEPDGFRRLRTVRWGLVPPWADDVRVGARLINARAETVAVKGAFAPALRARRCIVPMDGFYEWRARLGAAKQPVYITRRDGQPMAVAGLWERWHDPAGDPAAPALLSATIVTTAANDEVAPAHDRMPAMLDEEDWDRWLAGGADDDDEVAALVGLLAPAPEGLLEVRPVSSAVNRVANDGPSLIDAAAPEPVQLTLLG